MKSTLRTVFAILLIAPVAGVWIPAFGQREKRPQAPPAQAEMSQTPKPRGFFDRLFGKRLPGKAEKSESQAPKENAGGVTVKRAVPVSADKRKPDTEKEESNRKARKKELAEEKVESKKTSDESPKPATSTPATAEATKPETQAPAETAKKEATPESVPVATSEASSPTPEPATPAVSIVQSPEAIPAATTPPEAKTPEAEGTPVATFDQPPAFVAEPAATKSIAVSDLVSEDYEARQRAKFQKLKTQALEDKTIQALKEKADRASASEEKDAMRAYYRGLFEKMRTLDKSMAPRIEMMEKATEKRIDRM